MGFVYNNVWEAFCRTYLELNGYLVLSNVFVALMAGGGDAGASHYGLEADIIAYKIDGTNLEPYPVDVPVQNYQSPVAEFFAGVNRPDNLVYCEVKANLRPHGHQREIRKLLGTNGREKIDEKAKLIEQRLDTSPQIVLMAYQIGDESRQRIAEAGWLCKEFPVMYSFMKHRFREHRPEKRRVLYNDPWLEMIRFVDRLGSDLDSAER
jgi:hypothetical protein